MTAWAWWILGFGFIVVGLGFTIVGINKKAQEGTDTKLLLHADGDPVEIERWTRNFTPPTDEDFVYQPWKEKP